jgi:hypothetical protein
LLEKAYNIIRVEQSNKWRSNQMAKSYSDLKAFIAKGRNKTERRIANNTLVIDKGTHVAIRLHNTDIVEVYPDGTYVLDSGGWHTVTTKQRINTFAPVNLYQKDWTWYLWPGDTLFEDGIRVNSSGKVLDGRTILHLKEA